MGAGLTPLTCPGCGRPVPIGDGDLARCQACATDVPIPASYLALRTTAERDEEARARADAISDELTRPPSRAMRFWRTAGDVSVAASVVLVVAWLLVSIVMCIGTFVSAGFFGAIIMLIVGVFLGLPLLYNELLHGFAGPLSTDLADVWGGAGSYALLGLGFVLVFAVPRVLADYADAFESVRAMLRKVMSAPAPTEGGATECRACGAPLHVPSAAAHVRCVYCRCDNLVDASHEVRTKAEADTEIVWRDLESAIVEERRVAANGRRLVVIRLAKSMLLVPVFILLGRCVAGVNEDDATFWHRAVASSPMLPNIEDNPPLARERATSFDVHETFDNCDEIDCWAYYFVALAPGEELRITAEGDLRVLEIARRDIGSWYNPTYQWAAMEPGTGAPHAGWYRVKLATAKKRAESPPRVVWTASARPRSSQRPSRHRRRGSPRRSGLRSGQRRG